MHYYHTASAASTIDLMLKKTTIAIAANVVDRPLSAIKPHINHFSTPAPPWRGLFLFLRKNPPASAPVGSLFLLYDRLIPILATKHHHVDNYPLWGGWAIISLPTFSLWCKTPPNC